MRRVKSRRSGLVLALLLTAAFVPASALVYLQYRSLSQVHRQTRQGLFANLQQALIGARIEAGNDFFQWPRLALQGQNIHPWLQRRDARRMRGVAEATRRVWPEISLFFGYRNPPGSRPEVFIFRPIGHWGMEFSKADAAEPEVRKLIPALVETTSHWYAAYTDFAGERQQVFLHLVDADPIEPKGPHTGKIGYYGFAVPARVLGAQYLAGLLRKHLAGLTINPDHLPGGEAVGAIFDEGGVQRGTSTDRIGSTLPVRETLIENQPGILPGWTMRAGFPEGALSRFDRTQLTRGITIELAVTEKRALREASLGITTARQMQLARAKSEFVASVSHELKTPLSLIRGFIETLHLNRVSSSSQREEYFGIIETEIERLSNMIDRVLEMSKIEIGLKRYQPEMVDVASLIDDTLTHFAQEFERGSFTLERRIEKPLPAARVDPQAFSQALLNLLSNAVKYSGNDRRITVGAAQRNGSLEISVLDRGVGIPKREQSRIFDRFYRARATSAAAEGAGLGLALVKHFASAHGGEVTVTSEPGKGSRFAILLPVAD